MMLNGGLKVMNNKITKKTFGRQIGAGWLQVKFLGTTNE